MFLGAFTLALLLAAPMALAGNPDYLQDLCVADLSSEVKVNGFPCKANATADDFFSSVIAKPGTFTSPAGSVVSGTNVEKIPGLNTLGVSLARIDYAPGGLNPPHTHPRATELIFVLYGKLDVGFVTTANKLVAKTVAAGDVFAFPCGLVHFQIGMTLFGASPEVSSDVLARAFQIGNEEVDKIKAKFVPKKA